LYILDLVYAALSSIMIVNYVVNILYNFCAEQFCTTWITIIGQTFTITIISTECCHWYTNLYDALSRRLKSPWALLWESQILLVFIVISD